MLIDFFHHLKQAKLPVSTKEFLTLLEALQKHVAGHSIDEFYFLSRACLVKDETNYDKFDKAFGEYFKGVERIPGLEAEIPEDWLRLMAKKHLTPEEKAKLQALGWDKLMEEFKKRLQEQKKRHAGGSKWIGTGGSSPFGAHGYHPEGIRIGGESAGNRTASRCGRTASSATSTTRSNWARATSRWRCAACAASPARAPRRNSTSTAPSSTARNAGWLDILMRPERHNKVKVLLFLDIGGSMDDHIRVCEEMFSAAKTEFKHLEYFYFHNCVYDHVWRDNRRRHSERFPLWDVMHKYGPDYKLILVGDATMSPYEIMQPGGSVEYMNEESGATWMRRLLDTYPHAVWLNPEPEHLWPYRHSITLLHNIMGSRMFPLTLEGLERAMRCSANEGQ
jgi:uncharacterized protein with von Willebrand factor type A (vWA) domain